MEKIFDFLPPLSCSIAPSISLKWLVGHHFKNFLAKGGKTSGRDFSCFNFIQESYSAFIWKKINFVNMLYRIHVLGKNLSYDLSFKIKVSRKYCFDSSKWPWGSISELGSSHHLSFIHQLDNLWFVWCGWHQKSQTVRLKYNDLTKKRNFESLKNDPKFPILEMLVGG